MTSELEAGIGAELLTIVMPAGLTDGRASAWSALPFAEPASDWAAVAVVLAEFAVLLAVWAVRFAAFAARLALLPVFNAFLATFATEPIDGPPKAGETIDTASNIAQARTAAIAVLLMD